MTSWRQLGLLATLTVGLLYSKPASAQSARATRFEVAIGTTWMNRGSMGDRDANETRPPGGSFRLFATSTELGAATGVEGRIGVRVTRVLHVEVGASYAAPELRATISGDVENSVRAIASEGIRQFIVDGNLAVAPARWKLGNRGTTFVSGGAGYLRQLHDGATLVESGRIYQVGGGVKLALLSRNGSRLKVLGLRAEARALARAGGVALDSRPRVSPALSASFYVGL